MIPRSWITNSKDIKVLTVLLFFFFVLTVMLFSSKFQSVRNVISKAHHTYKNVLLPVSFKFGSPAHQLKREESGMDFIAGIPNHWESNRRS